MNLFTLNVNLSKYNNQDFLIHIKMNIIIYIKIMFIYCITPYNKLESNFIKIGFSEDISLLQKRYSTYYGKCCRYYHVRVKDKMAEVNIHNKLKDIGLHLENELYTYNKIYDFYFYIKMLKKFEHFNELIINRKDETDLHENNHIFDFIISLFEILNPLKKINIEFKNKSYKFYKNENLIIPYFSNSDIEELWKYYKNCYINSDIFYKSIEIFKTKMKLMTYINKPIIYKKYKISFKTNYIKISIIHEINFEDFLKEECINIDNKHTNFLIENIKTKDNMTKDELLKYIYYYNTSSYIYTKNMLTFDNKPEIKKIIDPLYGLTYLYATIEINHSTSFKNRLIYYDEKHEEKIFERIYLCSIIINKIGFNDVFDRNAIKISEGIRKDLLNYILEIKNDIKRLFKIKEIKEINDLIKYINKILIKTLSVTIHKLRKEDLFIIRGLEIYNNETITYGKITYTDQKIIDKIKKEEEHINIIINKTKK